MEERSNTMNNSTPAPMKETSSSMDTNIMPPPPTSSFAISRLSPRFSPRASPILQGCRISAPSSRSRSGSFRTDFSPVAGLTRTMEDRRSQSLGRLGDLPSPVRQSSGAVPYLPSMQAAYHDPAVEHALEAERSRIRDLEKEEVNMDCGQLRLALKRERAHSCRLAADLAALKSASVKSQAEAEAHEEGRINGLMRRLECLQREKGRIIVELEREEEMLTNTLQKKLEELRREKSRLEQQIEREHSSNSALRSQLHPIPYSSKHQQASQESSSEIGHDTRQN